MKLGKSKADANAGYLYMKKEIEILRTVKKKQAARSEQLAALTKKAG